MSTSKLTAFLKLAQYGLTTNVKPADYPRFVGLSHPTCRRFQRGLAIFKAMHVAENPPAFGSKTAPHPADVEADETLYKATVVPPNPSSHRGSPYLIRHSIIVGAIERGIRDATMVFMPDRISPAYGGVAPLSKTELIAALPGGGWCAWGGGNFFPSHG